MPLTYFARNLLKPFRCQSLKFLFQTKSSIQVVSFSVHTMSSSPKKDFQRLPTHVLPINYDITLKPDLVKFTFEGSEKIQVHVHDKTDRITLNVNEVKISENNLSVFYPHDHKSLLFFSI